MMAIYGFKDFLTLDDVADYLRDRGVCDLNLLDYQDQCKLTDLISNLATENKITPVFGYYGFAFDLSDPSNQDILTHKAEYKLFLAYSSRSKKPTQTYPWWVWCFLPTSTLTAFVV